jgi:hypothetical protein
MESHEYANLFPMMADADLRELGADIKKHGLRDAIVTLDGKILDGRNRHRACELVGVPPHYEAFNGDDALGFVISHNLHRRHLTDSQRAMVAGDLANLKHGGTGANQYRRAESPIGNSANSPIKTRTQAAELLNVSTRSVDRAKKVMADAIPEVTEMVKAGELSLRAGLAVSQLSEEEQAAAASEGVAAVKAAAKAAAAAKDGSEPEPVVVDGTKGDGKPNKATPYRPDQGEDWFIHAKIQMDKIHPNDISREKALRKMVAYCEERLKSKK